jgi:hypothetical protein
MWSFISSFYSRDHASDAAHCQMLRELFEQAIEKTMIDLVGASISLGVLPFLERRWDSW